MHNRSHPPTEDFMIKPFLCLIFIPATPQSWESTWWLHLAREAWDSICFIIIGMHDLSEQSILSNYQSWRKFLFLPVMQRTTSLWKKAAEHLQTGPWRKKTVMIALLTMERAWMASSMRMAPSLDNTVVRKRKSQLKETKAQRHLLRSTPWTPLFNL